MSPVLVASGVGVAFDGRPVLTEVDLVVGAGEMVAVIGPNGAGKSTLFRALCGLVAHTGSVTVDGEHCHHRERGALAYIPQRSDVDPDFPITVSQLVAGGRRRFRRFGRRSSAEDHRASGAALGTVGLDDVEGQPLTALSGGQLQRAFVARALAQEARVLLLDEALSGVDTVATDTLLGVFDDLRASGTTILIATHDLALARRRFPRCLALNGRVVADGAPDAVLGPGALDATFGSASVPIGG